MKGILSKLADAPSRHNCQLRWMLSPDFGLPRAPFRVFALNANLELTPHADILGPLNGLRIVPFPVPVARAIIGVHLTTPGAAALGFSTDGKIVAFAANNGTDYQVLGMDASAISYIMITGTGDITALWTIGAEELANHSAWVEIEHVGLPLANSAGFAGTGYDTSPQGLVSSPVSPQQAAQRRLASGSPLVGWSPVLPTGAAAPAWLPAQAQPFLADQQATLLPKLISMMQQHPAAPWLDKSATLTAPIKAQSPGSGPSSQPSQATYSPLALLLMAASSDPFSALGLGFGTAYTLAELTQLLPVAQPVAPAAVFNNTEYHNFLPFTGLMVTCDVTLNAGFTFPLTLASIVLSNAQVEIVPAAAGLHAAISGNYPPQAIDQPWLESVKLAWKRPETILPVQSTVASYAITRALPAAAAALLNRPRAGGGIQPYIPALPAKQSPDVEIAFEDIQAPTTVPNALLTYSVAAQDWFGVWSPWANTTVTLPGEPLQTPVLSDAKWLVPLSGTNPYSATLSVQVAWDWTTRSPKEIDLFLSLMRPVDNHSALPTGPVPAGVQKSVGGAVGAPLSITFNAAHQPQILAGGATISLVPTPSYNANGHDMRVYLVTIPGFSLDFAGQNEIVAQIWARGESNLNPTFSTTAQPANARVLSPQPPPAPQLQQIIWATLPDPAGISRVHLTWPAVPGVAGYFVYEATETRMIAVAEDAGFVPPPPATGKPITPIPDLTGPFADRLQLLRSLDWPKLRKAFTRLNSSKITATEMEVSFPRGSRVIHAFVVTAVSANNIESSFPATSQAFTASATPFVQMSRPPRISARADAATGIITITLEQRGQVTPARYDLLCAHRDNLATDAGLMGPPLSLAGVTTITPGPTPTSLPASVVTVFHHSGITPSWSRVWYRAVGVTSDNLTNSAPSGNTPPWGALGGRATPTEAVSVVLPPPNPPAAPTISQQSLIAGGSVLLLIHTSAPASTTPLGSHILKVVQSNHATAKDPQPFYIPLESAPYKAVMPVSGPPGQLFRMVTAGQTVIGLRLAATTNTTVTVTLTDPLGRDSAAVFVALK
jgi:hypothetical protein